MERINIQLNNNLLNKLCSKKIEVSTIGVLNNEQVIIAYYYSDGTYNDSIFLADKDLNTIHEFSMAEQIKVERENLTFLMFSPDATLLWIINNCTSYIYNTINYNLVHTWVNDKDIYGCSMSSDNKKVAFVDDYVVYVYENGKELFSYKSTYSTYTRFSPDSKLIMSYGVFLAPENNIKIHNTSGDVLYDLKMNGPIRVINFTPDNNIIFFKGVSLEQDTFDSDFHIWDIKNNKLIKTIENEHLDIKRISFSKDGKYIYCQFCSNGFKILDTNDKIIKKYNIDSYKIDIEYTLDYKYLMYSYKNKLCYKKIMD
jgi:hypothetical protein